MTTTDARKRNRDMADAHATARARDARVEESFEERAERYGLDWDVVAHLMSEQPTRRAYRTRTQAIDPETGTFTPLTQEPDMTKHDRHDELVARGGLYAKLAAMQFGLVADTEPAAA